MMRFKNILDDKRSVSPVIGVILMVAITIVLAAVLYVWVVKYSLGERTPTGVFSFTSQTVSGGAAHYSGDVYIFENKKVRLSDIQVLVNTKIDDEDRYGMGDLDGFSGTTGIVSEWHFNSGNGSTAYDSSGNENDGTIYGANWTSGVSGLALSLDGLNDYVAVADDASLKPSQYAIEAWVKISTSQRPWNFGSWVIGKEYGFAGYGMAIGTQEPGIYHSDGSNWHRVEANVDITLNEWHHIAGTYDGTTVRVYVDGSLENSVNYGFANTDTDLFIGAWNEAGCPYNFFKGTMDEVRIHNRVLTAGEVRVHAGGLAVFFQDAEGDGMLSSTDVFTVRGADPGDKISLIYKPTGGLIASHTF